MNILQRNLIQLRNKAGLTQEQLAKKIGSNQKNISAYETGKANPPYPVLVLLSRVFNCNPDDIHPLYKYEDQHYDKIKSNVVPANPSEFRKVPVISMAAAAEWNGTYMPLTDFIDEHTDEYIYFPGSTERDFVVKITGSSMSPWYPDGTYVLASDCMPISGDRVVVKMTDGEILFKVFIDEGESVKLMSINRANGKDMTFSKRSTDIAKIWPIKMSLRDERAMDIEMKEAGIKHFWENRDVYSNNNSMNSALKAAESNSNDGYGNK